MEDLKARLKYNDINIRSRCMQKLLNSVKRKTKGNIINASSVQVPELSLILEACEDDSSITSNLAVQAVMALVSNNCMNVNYAIDKLLGCLKSPCNYQAVIKGISILLIHECNHASESKKGVRYSLLFPKHPLITAIENKEDSFPYISECITESLVADYDKTLQAMMPVICYMLYNPVQKQELNYLRVLFLETFIFSQKDLSHPALCIMKYIPFIQVESLARTTEVSFLLRKLSAATINIHEQECVSFTKSLLLASCSLAERGIHFGLDPSPILELLLELCPLLPKITEKSSSSANVCLILISYMLRSSSGLLLNKIAILGLKLLDSVAVSPTVAAVLTLSVLHLLPEPSLMSYNDSLKSCLSKLLGKLENDFLKNESLTWDFHETSIEEGDNCSPILQNEYETFNFFEAFTSRVEMAMTCVRFSKLLDKSSSRFKLDWLKSVKQYVDSCNTEKFDIIYSLVAALFLISPDKEVYLSSCLETLESVLIKSTHLSTRVFSLLLYKLSLVESPKSKLLILNFLPKSSVHKYAIPPVLSVLQMMANETELKAQAIYMMLQLWKRQDRCFPHLHSLLTEINKVYSFDSGVNEVLVAQAAAILEICSTEPEKYGHDFLSTLSAIFNKCHDDASLPVACLAIDGIIALCKSEFIDIRSTWKALSSRLYKDKRELVSCRMYQLLALIPEFQVKSHEYDKFMSETVANIWKQISAGASVPNVTSEAFRTLAKFPMDCHVLKHLPAAAKENLKLPASMKATPFEMSKLPEDVLSYIPGYCFLDLLTSYDESTVLEGYSSFLNSLVKMEIEELPRSIYSQTRHIAKRKKVSEALSKVPEFLCTQFHARKSPALQKNLAVGVLYCYEPPIEMGKDGMPMKRSIATQSRSYEQVLTVLLNEVNIDTSEWHRCILTSSAWGAFMERAFFACEEARKAELDLQNSHGHINLSSEELNHQSKSAWLWVRERLLGIIKTNAKSTPTAHANAVFAVSGLVLALDKFHSSLDEGSKTLSDDNEKYISHRNFTAEYVETLLCAMHPEYTPSGKVQSWLLTHLSRPNSSAGYLVTGCASSSLCHLTSVLTSHYVDEIPSLFQVMLQNLSHSSPVLSFYSGKGIGLLIKSLCEAGFADTGESQVNLLLNTVKEMVKIYDNSEGNLTSCLIGLTISMSSLSQTTDEDIKDWISITCKAFYEKLMDEEKSSMQFEMLCTCVTAMIISAAEGSCLPIHDVEDLVAWIEMNKLELPQCSGISVSLGMLIEAFERFGHSEGTEMKQKVLKGWFNTLTSERKPTLQRMAALNGLCSLFSCGRGLISVKIQPSPESISGLNDLIPFMFQILSASRDTGLQNICSWEVGRLFSVHSNNQQVESSVSSSYSYLGEKSILKPLMNIITSYQKEDETLPKHCHIRVCLKSLAEPFHRPLPPINWFSVLTPFLQEEDTGAKEAALKIAIYQSTSSSYASNLISSYCIPPLIHTLPESCFKFLLDNMPGLLLVLPAPKLQIFLQTAISQTIKKEDALETLGNITLQGILSSLKQTGLKEQSKKILHDAFIYIFKYFKAREDYLNQYLPWISQALLFLPAEVLDSLLLVSQNLDEVSQLTMIWCYLVKTGKKPLKSLRPCVEEGKCASAEQKEKICSHIYDCFINGIQNKESEIYQTSKCIAWLHETIGWIKVLEDSKSKYQLLTTGEVYTFLVDVCLATIIGCSGLERSYHFLPQQSLSHHLLLSSFPQAVNTLSRMNEWVADIDKIIDWLLLLLKSQYLKDDEKYFIKLSLCSLRNTKHYEKREVWTEVICNIMTSE